MTETFRIADTYSDRLQQKGWDAEEAGSEVKYYWHDKYNVLRYIEIDGEEFENPEYEDEFREQYWLEDGYRVAERYWRG